jgi:hypothetical protein
MNIDIRGSPLSSTAITNYCQDNALHNSLSEAAPRVVSKGIVLGTTETTYYTYQLYKNSLSCKVIDKVERGA